MTCSLYKFISDKLIVNRESLQGDWAKASKNVVKEFASISLFLLKLICSNYLRLIDYFIIPDISINVLELNLRLDSSKIFRYEADFGIKFKSNGYNIVYSNVF